MAKIQKINWSRHAKQDLYALLKYWYERNQSAHFPLKLLSIIEKELRLLSMFTYLGRRTTFPGGKIRSRLIHDHYIVFYTIKGRSIYIIRIWDARQDPSALLG